MTERRQCGADVWRCPTCDQAVAKAIVRQGNRCPRPGCEQADPPYVSTCRTSMALGALRCFRHGGYAPQSEARAKGRRVEAEAWADLAKLGVPVDTTPIEALEAMLCEAAGNVAALRLMVWGLDDEIYGPDHTGDGEPHVVVRMYDAERDRLARIAKDCAALGIDERRVRIAEGQAERLFTAVSRALEALPDDQRDAFKLALAGELRRPALAAS